MDILQTLLTGVTTTLGITFGALLLGAILAIPLAAMRRSRIPVVSYIAKAIIEVVRGIPILVWLFAIYFILGETALKLSPFTAAVVGLGIVSMAYIAEIYRSGIQGVNPGQFGATQALAMPPIKAFFTVIAPQAIPIMIPTFATFAIGMLKDSALASIISVQDITFRASQEAQANLNGLTTFSIAALLYVLLSIPIAIVARRTGTKLAEKVGS